MEKQSRQKIQSEPFVMIGSVSFVKANSFKSYLVASKNNALAKFMMVDAW